MDGAKIQAIYKQSMTINPELSEASEADRIWAKQTVEDNKTFRKLLANLNIDDLKYKRPNFAEDDDIVRELDSVIEYVRQELNKDPRYVGQIEKVGSCIDDSKVHRIDEADTLYVLNRNVKIKQKADDSFEIDGVGSPSEFVSDFADCIESIMQKWRPTGALTHGGYLAPSFSGVRYNGPAVTALFVYNDGGEPLHLSLDITPTFRVPKHVIPDDLSSNIKRIKQKHTDKIYDMTGIYLFPNIINNKWQLTTAQFEAKLFRDLPKRSPLKQAYNFVKIISYMVNKTNEESIFKHNINASKSSKDIEKDILQCLNPKSKIKDVHTIMRYAHLFLTKETAKKTNEIGKSPVSTNTTAMKHILLREAFCHPDLSGESSNIEDDVYRLVTKAFESFLKLESGYVRHALLGCNISIYSISKPSLMDGMGPLLQCVLMEECRAIYNKIKLFVSVKKDNPIKKRLCLCSQDSSDVNTVDPGTCILTHLKQFVVPVNYLTDPRYHYRVSLDASITPRRNPRMTNIYQIISACANSCGGTISMPIDNREMIEDDTLSRWKDRLTTEIEQRFQDVALSFVDKWYKIEVEPSVHSIEVDIDGNKSYMIQPDGLVVMAPVRCISDQQQSSCESTGDIDLLETASTSKHHILNVPSTAQSKDNLGPDIAHDTTTTHNCGMDNTHGTTIIQPQSPESAVDDKSPTGRLQDVVHKIHPSSDHMDEGDTGVDQLHRTNSLTWTNTSDWEKHLTVPQRDFLLNYELYSKTFCKTSPLCIYPSVRLLEKRFHDRVNALAERYKRQKGFLLWSQRLMTLFDPGCEPPDPPEGHQLDVLCVWGEDTLKLDLCSIIDGNHDHGKYQSYLAHTGRLLRFLVTKKIRESKWMTTAQVGRIFVRTCVVLKNVNDINEHYTSKEQVGMTETAHAIVNKQLASLSLLLLDNTHKKNLQVQLAESTLLNLSYEQSRVVMSSRRYNWIEGPPGSGKSMIALYVCDQYGKDNTAFICTTQSYKAFVEYQNKATVFIVERDRKLKDLCHHLADFDCIIIDDVHNLPCAKQDFIKLLQTVHVNKSDILLFADCRYQNYKYPENGEIKKWFRMFCAECDETMHDAVLTEVHRNTRKVASFLSAGIGTEGDKRLDAITCAHTIDGNDVVFRRTFNLTASSDENGVLVYVKSLLEESYVPQQIVVLLDADKSMLAQKVHNMRHVLSTYLPGVATHGADTFPRTGIVVDCLDNFMGLDAPVCIFPINKLTALDHPKEPSFMQWITQKLFGKSLTRAQVTHGIVNSKYRMFIASRAVYHMAFLMEEDFDVELFEAMNMKHIKSWEPDYHHTGDPQTYGMEGRGKGEFIWPQSVAACPRTGRLVVTDWINKKIRVLTGDLRPVVTFGSQGEGDGEYTGPWGVTVSPAGDVYVTDSGHNRVQVHGLDGGYRRQFGSRGSGPGQYNRPCGITNHGDRLFICDSLNNRVAVCDMKGHHITEIAVPSLSEHIAISRDGRQLAVSALGGGLHLMTTTGFVTRTLQRGKGDILWPSGVCYDGYKHLIVADQKAHCLRVLREDGSQVCEITVPREGGRYCRLMGLSVTADGNIVTCDTQNQCIYLYKVPRLS